MTGHPLLGVRQIAVHPAAYLAGHGEVFATWDHRTQGSGNVSYGVQVAGERFFVKTADDDAPPVLGAPVPYYGHAGRVALLRTAVAVAASVDHPALARLRHVVDSPVGPMLVYDFADGELLHVRRDRRAEEGTAYRRFAALPAAELLGALGVLVDLHRALGEAGWVAQDLYDGCLLYDFEARRLTVVDLDTYSQGPVVNTMGRMFGATRFMAPEELTLGAVVDQRSTVFTLGRLGWHFGTRLTERAEDFVGPPELADLLTAATDPDPRRRPQSCAELADAWVARG